jgi:hypothetical protein
MVTQRYQPFMETAVPQSFPFMEMVEPDLETDAAKMRHQLDRRFDRL